MPKKPAPVQGERVMSTDGTLPKTPDSPKTKEDVEYIKSLSTPSKGTSSVKLPEGAFLIQDRPANCVWEDHDTNPVTLHWYSNANDTDYCGDSHWWIQNWHSYEEVDGLCPDGCKKFRVRYG